MTTMTTLRWMAPGLKIRRDTCRTHPLQVQMALMSRHIHHQLRQHLLFFRVVRCLNPNLVPE
jgi:hypothetical protein